MLTMTDFTEYETIEREVVRGTYRDVETLGYQPSSGGVHVIQMLNLLEGFDIPSMGFGSPESLHLILEVLKIAFADRAAVTADPAFVDVPTDRLLSKAYADERRADIDLANAKEWTAGVALPESPNTTHVTTADGDGTSSRRRRPLTDIWGVDTIQIPGSCRTITCSFSIRIRVRRYRLPPVNA